MSNRKTTADKIEEAREKIAQYESHMKKLLQKQKQDERKVKTKRQTSRAGVIEKLLPDTITLTDEQFKAFIERTAANDFGRRALATIVKGGRATAASQTAESAQSSTTATPPEAEQTTLDQQQQT